MSNFPRSPKLLKGALVEISNRYAGSTENVIAFQYNPETMTRKLEPWNAEGGGQSNTGPEGATAQPVDPPESFDVVLEFDAADDLEFPEKNQSAVKTGVAQRIAALELLLYPLSDSGTGLKTLESDSVKNNSKDSGNVANAQPAIRGTVPDVFFIWGEGRMVPVRLTSFSVEEQAYSPELYPIRAKVSIGMKILAPRNLVCNQAPNSQKAITAYKKYIQNKYDLASGYITRTAKDNAGFVPNL